jgi:hypothetical protein
MGVIAGMNATICGLQRVALYQALTAAICVDKRVALYQALTVTDYRLDDQFPFLSRHKISLSPLDSHQF